MAARERSSKSKGRFINDALNGSFTEVELLTEWSKSEITLSLNNPMWDHGRGRKSGVNIGGPFAMHYWKIVRQPVNFDTYAWGPNELHYRGPIGASGPSYADVASWNIDNPMSFIGSKAPSLYDEMKPTKPSQDTANALFELRDLAGMLKKLHEPLKNIKQLPIAYEFGWSPLFRDIRNLIREQWRWQKKLRFLIENEGKPVRTRSRVHTTTDSTYPSFDVTGYNQITPLQDFYIYDGQPTTRRSVEWKTDYWASARWIWFLPSGPRDISWNYRMWGKLMGLDVSPSVVWNALPWSWLIDWFTTAGDSIKNLESGVADRLYADRFYCMAHRYRHDTWRTTARLYDRNHTSVSINPVTESWTGWKTRIRGNPFGVLLTESQLNDNQWRILGELGLSRL